MKNIQLVIGGVVLVALGTALGYEISSFSASQTKAPVVESHVDPSVSSSAHHGSSDGMRGTMDAMVLQLKDKTGDDFDKAFIDEMIVHHQGAIEMAELVLRTSQRSELLQLAKAIISAQSGEIDQMQRWRSEWFGN